MKYWNKRGEKQQMLSKQHFKTVVGLRLFRKKQMEPWRRSHKQSGAAWAPTAQLIQSIIQTLLVETVKFDVPW